MNTADKLWGSERCQLFKDIADKVWFRILRKHKLGLNDKEVAITNDIIADILEYRITHLKNFDVYARDGYLESVYGNDIDLFVEIYPDEYKWFALQAKLLKKNNKYNSLRDSSDGDYQWDKLYHLEEISGCTPYYLLYNGVENYKHPGKDLCNKEFNESQFGCSLVEPREIETLATKIGRTGRYINPKFEDIHPKLAQPWRVLVCCQQEVKNIELYSFEEIKDSLTDLKIITPIFKDVDSGMDKIDDENKNIDFDENPENRIFAASKEAGWNPQIRIVVSLSPSQE
mgnify:CR=1 FL=1